MNLNYDSCRRAEKVLLFIDQEPALLGGSLSAFVDEIMGRNCDVFYVHFKPEMTICEKNKAIAAAKKALNRLVDDFPYHSGK